VERSGLRIVSQYAESRSSVRRTNSGRSSGRRRDRHYFRAPLKQKPPELRQEVCCTSRAANLPRTVNCSIRTQNRPRVQRAIERKPREIWLAECKKCCRRYEERHCELYHCLGFLRVLRRRKISLHFLTVASHASMAAPIEATPGLSISAQWSRLNRFMSKL
jgi:hypothetical protein